MKRKAALGAACMLGFATTTADAGLANLGTSSSGQDLRFVSATQIPTFNDNHAYSLCHLVDFWSFSSVPIYTKVTEYALSQDGCISNDYHPIPVSQFQSFQTQGLIPPDLPTAPSASFLDLVKGNLGLIFIALAILLKVALMFAEFLKRPKKASHETAMQALAAMCYVAMSDQDADETEVADIVNAMSRLTQQNIKSNKVRSLLRDMMNDPIDPSLLGQDLDETEKPIVLEAAMQIAVSDGRIDPREYDMICQIARVLNITGDEFRAILDRVAGHLASQAEIAIAAAQTQKSPFWKARPTAS